MVVPAALMAVSNMPSASETTLEKEKRRSGWSGGKGKQGWTGAYGGGCQMKRDETMEFCFLFSDLGLRCFHYLGYTTITITRPQVDHLMSIFEFLGF